jgi:hypothetical protein
VPEESLTSATPIELNVQVLAVAEFDDDHRDLEPGAGLEGDQWVSRLRTARRGAAADLFRLRGELLSEASTLEQSLGFAIRFFFEVSVDRHAEFQVWVLGQLSVSQKLDVFRRIVHVRESPFMATLLSRLQAANTLRNALAHSAVSAFPKVGEFEISSSTLKRTGWTPVESDLPRLERWLEEIEELSALVTVVADRIIAGPRPFDPADTDWPTHVADVYRHGVVAVTNKFLDSMPTYQERDSDPPVDAPQPMGDRLGYEDASSTIRDPS